MKKRLIGLSFFILILIGLGIFYTSQTKKNIIPYTATSMSKLSSLISSNETFYVVFYSSQCATCEKLKQDFQDLKKNYQNEINKLHIYGINIDKDQNFQTKNLNEFQVDGVPFIVKYENGQKKQTLWNDITKEKLVHFFQLSNANVVSAIYFYSSTCGSCNQVSSYLEKMQSKRKQLKLVKYNIAKPEYKSLFNQYCKSYNVSNEKTGLVPAIFIRNQALFDKEDIEKNFQTLLEQTSGPQTKILANKSLNFDADYETFQSIKWLKLISAGLINGINPCSLSMLIFLLMLLECSPKKLLRIGLFFCFGKFIAFLLLGTLFYKLLGILNGHLIQNIVYYFFILLAFFLAMLNFYDFIAIRKHQLGDMKAQLPTGFRRLNHQIIKKGSFYFLEHRFFSLISFGLGMIIACTEFLCAGQIYLTSIVTILQTDRLALKQAFIYLFVYSLCCIIPVVLIVLLIASGKKTLTISTFITNHLTTIKLLYAGIFLIMAFLMIYTRL